MIFLRRKWIWAAVCALLVTLAQAATVENLYESAQPITSSQDAALVEALKSVVIRVSGQRDAPARLGSALGNPRQYVQRFGVTAEDVLEVGFDDISVDQMLTDAGLPIWGRERPVTLTVLSLEETGGDWASAEAAPADKDRLSTVAHARGLPLQWGALDSQDRNVLTTASDESALLSIAARNNANAVLIGRGRRDSMQWTLATVDGVVRASGTMEDGIHLAADTFARVFAATGTSLTQVIVEISGIANLDAYANALNYLEGMTSVRGVAVQSVTGDTLQFRLAIRGNAEALQRAIALDRRLVPIQGAVIDAGAADQRLAFRYQP